MRIREPITIPSPIELEESQVKRGSNNNGSGGEGTRESDESLFDIDRSKGEVEGGGEGNLGLRESRDETSSAWEP